MKSLTTILPFVGLIIASPLFEQIPIGNEQYPGFDIDLNAQRLVQLEGQEPVWMSEWDKIAAKARGIRFFDITETPNLESLALLRTQTSTFPTKPNATDKVKAVFKNLSTEDMKKNLEKFTSYRTRYYRSDTGKASQEWLLGRINEITASYASASLQKRVSLQEFKHEWKQSSIIARINGSSFSDEVVILGAHLDSTNLFPFFPAPGADDDGSGTMTILESYRALLAADFRPERTVEFHWYSAEEAGLLGSQAIAQSYAERSIDVIAMSHFDMTAWVKKGTEEVAGIITDNVDPELTAFHKMLVETYLDIPWANTKCGYACSDHASWARAGYKSAFTIESKFEDSNHNIHSTNDRIDISAEFSFDHMLQFSKLAAAFAVELGGWAKD